MENPLNYIFDMRKLAGKNWEIELPPEWVGEHEEDCSAVYHPDGVGALQISAYSKEGEATDLDLLDFASDQIKSGAKLIPVEFGFLKGFTLSFCSDNTYWQYWYLALSKMVFFVTYNCEDEDRNRETETINEILSTLTVNK